MKTLLVVQGQSKRATYMPVRFRSGLPEVCGGAALLVDPGSGGTWLNHIESLVWSRKLGDELAHRGRIRASDYSWKASAQGYLELLDQYDE